MDVLIRHMTRYRYAEPVKLGRHRLMLRPRDSFDMRLIRTGLTITPVPELVWTHDVYGNSICWAYFSDETGELSIDSELLLRRYQPAAPKPATLPWRQGAPIAYSDDERIVLEPFITPATRDRDGEMEQFAQSSAGQLTVEIGHPLMALATGIHRSLVYRIRHEEGTQMPLETLKAGSGSCRDYAWLFIECARRLGYAARFVTGYLHSGRRSGQNLTAPSVGFSHAWAEVFVPGDGWVEFDPTNLLVADRQLVRVAVTRTPGEALPVLGSFTGPRQRVAPEVHVTVAAVEPGGETDVAGEQPRAPDAAE